MKFKPKKSLGQNFLKDTAIIEKIIQVSEIKPDDFIIEIGPGLGILTEKLVQKAKKVIAIEIDSHLVQELRNKFKNCQNLEIINADILKINLPELLEKNNITAFEYKVIANLPYYITSPIIRLLLEAKYQPKEMILMVQKEVAERITARPGEMSILSVSVQYYASAQKLFDVKKESFSPIPEVDSSIIKIKPYSPNKNKNETKIFFSLVKAGFSSRRKTLANNLFSSLKINKRKIENYLESLGLYPMTRAQELSLENWEKLAEKFGPKDNPN